MIPIPSRGERKRRSNDDLSLREATGHQDVSRIFSISRCVSVKEKESLFSHHHPRLPLLGICDLVDSRILERATIVCRQLFCGKPGKFFAMFCCLWWTCLYVGVVMVSRPYVQTGYTIQLPDRTIM